MKNKSVMKLRYPSTLANQSQAAVAKATGGTAEQGARKAKRNTRLRGASKRVPFFNDYLTGGTDAKGKGPKRKRTSQGTREASV